MMRLLRRNLSKMYYCLYDHKEKILDENGHFTGDWKLVYKDPVEIDVAAAPPRGYVHADYFGRMDSYDRVVVCADPTCPIDEETLIFLDKEPEFYEDGAPKANYSVRRVAPAKNSILYALMRIT